MQAPGVGGRGVPVCHVLMSFGASGRLLSSIWRILSFLSCFMLFFIIMRVLRISVKTFPRKDLGMV